MGMVPLFIKATVKVTDRFVDLIIHYQEFRLREIVINGIDGKKWTVLSSGVPEISPNILFLIGNSHNKNKTRHSCESREEALEKAYVIVDLLKQVNSLYLEGKLQVKVAGGPYAFD